MKKLLTKFTVLFSILITSAGTTYAQIVIHKPETLPGPSEYTQTSKNALTAFFERNVFGNLTQTLIAITGALALLFAIVSGAKMLMGYGNEDTYTSAKKGFFMSLAGFGLALLSYAIVSIVSSI